MMIPKSWKFKRHQQQVRTVRANGIRDLWNIKKVHNRLDEAFTIAPINSSILHMAVHSHEIDKFQHIIQCCQNDFSITTKALLCYRLARELKRRNPETATVVIYAMILMTVIFMTDIFSF